MIVPVEDRYRNRICCFESLLELLSTVFKPLDALDDLLNGQLFCEPGRVLPLQVPVVALVLSRATVAVGAHNAHLRKAL